MDFELNEKKAEFIGVVIGDGNIYSNRKSKLKFIEISGHPTEDMHYLSTYLNKLINHEFGYPPKYKVRSRALRLRINNKLIATWLVNLGIPAGRGKGEKVLIPKVVLRKSKYYLPCIRGICDTDGSIYFDYRKSYKSPYPRIEFHMKNRGLLKQINQLLNKKDIKSKVVGDGLRLIILGREEVLRYNQLIGFSNNKHIRKISKLKKASVAQWWSA